MKFILTFLAGTLLGAVAVFMYLRQIGQEPPGPALAVSPPVGSVSAPATPPATVPGPPVVTTDLSEADLPLRPPATFPVPSTEAPAADPATPAAAPAATPAGAAPASPPKLMVPVEGITYAQLKDNFDQPRGSERHHEALDIMAPTGTKVFAVADGKVVKLFNSKPGGLTVYQFDPSDTYAYYYAHLDKYAEGLQEGAQVKRGDLIGYVGATGNANPAAPHLHFAVVQLTPEKQWWKGTPINPYPLMAE